VCGGTGSRRGRRTGLGGRRGRRTGLGLRRPGRLRRLRGL